MHGEGDNGFVATLVGIARERGVAAYVGDGSNRWPAVHRSDAARLARLAVEVAPAGSVLHAVGDEGVPFHEIAEIPSASHLGIPTSSVDRLTTRRLAPWGLCWFSACRSREGDPRPAQRATDRASC